MVGLPQERGQFTGDRDRDDPGRFAAAEVEALPLAVQPLLGAPGDRAHAWILPRLATVQVTPTWGRRR